MASHSVGRGNQRTLCGSSGFELDIEGEEEFCPVNTGSHVCMGIEGGGEGWKGREPDQCHVGREFKHEDR